MLIFTIFLQWFSKDTAFNRKTPTIPQKSPEKQSHQQNLHCAASYGLSTWKIEEYIEHRRLLLCFICFRHVIRPFEIHHVNINFTERPFWSRTFPNPTIDANVNRLHAHLVNSDAHSIKHVRNNGTFEASLCSNHFIFQKVWTRYRKTYFPWLFVIVKSVLFNYSSDCFRIQTSALLIGRMSLGS